MNISNLFRTMRARMQYAYDSQSSFPMINIIEGDYILPFNVFPNKYTGIDDVLLPLSSLWYSITDKNKIEIGDFMVGKRLLPDFFILMKWMSLRANIDNSTLDIAIDTREG